MQGLLSCRHTALGRGGAREAGISLHAPRALGLHAWRRAWRRRESRRECWGTPQACGTEVRMSAELQLTASG